MGVNAPLGASVFSAGIRFAVWSGTAERIQVCLFDGDTETDRLDLQPEGEGVHVLYVPGLGAGTRYGFRADGAYAPERGLWFDPDKLLMDPYAREIDCAYAYDPRLCARRGEGGDTAPLMPKAVAVGLPPPVPTAPPLFQPGGLVYEIAVRGFSMRHPAIPGPDRGTVRALAHPAVIEHLQRLGVSAVELMPVTAWIDERHLPPLGLANAWGYNPVSFMALDPRLAPGGLADLRQAIEALHAADIGVILDLVFNHTGESDALGPTLSLRGLDANAYYRHTADGVLVNDTGTGNTVACDHPAAQRLILDSLRHFVRHAGVDGFRFDLAPVLGRVEGGFDREAPLLAAMRADPLLADRVLIAEPWDIGPGGYQLGNFPRPFLEWNDRYRDDVRRFWRGDAGMAGALATRLAGSSDVFGSGGQATRTVNFIAAHDGMTLADVTAYACKHNEANGETNRDGHDENFSWAGGTPGDLRALLATLFASRGTVMLTAGDEFGRTQGGNNNAYAQDNATTWLDWQNRDQALESYACALSALRRSLPLFGEVGFFSGRPGGSDAIPDVAWLTETGEAMAVADWQDRKRHRLVMLLDAGNGERLAVLFNGDRRACRFTLPSREGHGWTSALERYPFDLAQPLPGRSVVFMSERATQQESRDGG